ncbi:MAG: glycosyltransferase N-terminal domain-containing protein, partial [Gemmatimonadota bacterium]
SSRIGTVLFDQDSKIAEGVRGRRSAAFELEEWGRARRDRARPLVWFHAPSVGEGLQARAVMEALLEARPDVQLVFTFFSPSARGLAARMPARVAGYLPWDAQDECGLVLDALAPELVVFTKTEVWPGLSAAAERRGIPTALVAATLPSGAARLRWPARRLLRPAFGRLARVGAISHEDGARFSRLGVDPERVCTTGDPGIDSAFQRVSGADPRSAHLAPFLGNPDPGSAPPERSMTARRPTLIAGSTWEPDEDVLLPAFAAARRVYPELRMVLAPHEPAPGHLARIESRLREAGASSRRLAEVEATEDAGGVDVVVVDRVGVLADLYKAGTFSYIGGGFGRHGLHSVLEPAAARLPVLFGPHHSNSRAAADLLRENAARVVHDAEDTVARIAEWIREPDARNAAADAALAYISRHRGAARESAALLVTLITGPRTKGSTQ